jgi:hypothetical protein
MRGLRALGFCILTVLPGLAMAADGQPVTIASISDFPNCPAPAVNGLNLRVSRDADGTRLRAFLAPSGDAVVRVTMGGEALGAFAIERLAPSEVRHLAIETLLPPLTEPADITARIDFGAGLPTGKVAATFDCQLSDNAVIRDGASIRATLDRIAG